MLLENLRAFFLKNSPGAIVFDIRVCGWPDVQALKIAKNLSRSLQNICEKLRINSSVFLCNGQQLLGNAIGKTYESIEAKNILGGGGPLDLKKYALEMGMDFLLLAKKFHHKLEAKKFIKNGIIQGKFVPRAVKLEGNLPSYPSFQNEKSIEIISPRKGYIRRLSMEAIFQTKSKLDISRPGSGMRILKKVGDRTEKGDPLVQLFAPENEETYRMRKDILKAYAISPKPLDFQPLILERPGIKLIT